MAYEAVTPAEFKAAKPQFAAVADVTVQMYLDMAARVVDQSWTAGDYKNAIIAFACHLMSLEGLGTDAASQSHASGAVEYETIKSGVLTLTRFRAAAAATTPYMDWLNSTPCGKYFVFLLRLNRGGPRVATVSTMTPSGYAKDWCGPTYGWPGVFY
ncbi:DUF4054 domain-containing protein [Mesorhizobium sp. M0938]|uniref:DUF4054 domain-containing protein n=1 Tax=unclassified Mesorhizobium TaxID=325217 RepID=UPI003334DD28